MVITPTGGENLKLTSTVSSSGHHEDDTSYTSYTYDYEYTDKPWIEFQEEKDEDGFTRKERLEQIKMGWHVPRKLLCRSIKTKTKVKITIRNSLPIKLRRD